MDRRIRLTKKDRKGNIVALCNPGQPWSPRRTADVIRDIQTNKVSYYVRESERPKYVRVVSGALVSTAETSDLNNLHNLPSA
ncbi:MAG: hypothetical protein U0263_14200 [Polyangiaceae bacterium]